MVKIQTISRLESDYTRQTKLDLHRVHHAPGSAIHQFAQAREYQRALQSTKIDKIFAKPFLGSLAGHSDAISVLAKNPNNLGGLLSGSWDGEIRFWNIGKRKGVFGINAHERMVKGLAWSRSGGFFVSSGDDKVKNQYEF